MINPAVAWIAAGAAVLAYPTLRPYADETSLAGLAAMASTAWIGSHVFGMMGFVLLTVAVRSSHGLVRTARSGRAAATLMGAALVLLLPCYGVRPSVCTRSSSARGPPATSAW